MNSKIKIALVTGASKGVGRGIAVGLAAAGWDVVVNYHRDAKGAADTADEVRGAGDKPGRCKPTSETACK